MEFTQYNPPNLKYIKGIAKDMSLLPRDVEVALCHILKISRADYHFDDNRITLTEPQFEQTQKALNNLQNNMPVEQITKLAYFWKYAFKVSKDVLIPRPETELIIESVLKYFNKTKPLKIADLGTGSGILAICLAKEFTNSAVLAADISSEAIKIAKQNAIAIGVESQIKFVKSDWFDQILDQKFDLIVSNPPYITTEEFHTLAPKVRNFEPKTALTDMADGLSHYKNIAHNAKHYLNHGGLIMLEHGQGQAKAISQIFMQNGFQILQNIVDLGQRKRILIVKL